MSSSMKRTSTSNYYINSAASSRTAGAVRSAKGASSTKVNDSTGNNWLHRSPEAIWQGAVQSKRTANAAVSTFRQQA